MTTTNKTSGPTGLALFQGVHHFNKQNWTGENAAIRVRKDGSFQFQSEQVELRPHPETTANMPMCEVWTSDNKNHRLGVVVKVGACEWLASSDYGSLTRSDSCPQVAVAKLMSNI